MRLMVVGVVAALALVVGLALVTNQASTVSADGGFSQVLVHDGAGLVPGDGQLDFISAFGVGHEITMGGNCNNPPRRPPPCNGPPGRDPGNS